MKRILIAAVALSAMAGAAVAQPAYHGQGGPPPQYPPCTHHGEDRCAQHGDGGWRGGGGHWGRHRGDWGHHHHGDWGHHHGDGDHHWHHHHHSSTDGERG